VSALAVLAGLRVEPDPGAWALRATERPGQMREELDLVAAVYGLASVDPSSEPAPIYDAMVRVGRVDRPPVGGGAS